MSNEPIAYFITWTTYGTWLPGDTRGWRKRIGGYQDPQPLLEDWCREKMLGDPIILTTTQREKVDAVCRRHADIRKWPIHAINARTNHVHIVVTADCQPKKARDQFKANATQELRKPPDARIDEKMWTRGGDCEVLYDDNELYAAVDYVLNAQDF